MMGAIVMILSLLSVVSSYTLCRFVHLELLVLPTDLITGINPRAERANPDDENGVHRRHFVSRQEIKLPPPQKEQA